MFGYNKMCTLLFLLLLYDNYIIIIIIFAVFKKHFYNISILYYFTIYQSILIVRLLYTNRITYDLFSSIYSYN
jgi:hypothetical protein